MSPSNGIAAALCAPLLEASGFLEWDRHWKVNGGSAFGLNLYKCNFAALGFLCMIVLCGHDGFLRMRVLTVANVGNLMLSSALGIIIGDSCELEALRLVGARRVLTVVTIKPFAAAFLGAMVLGERLYWSALLGMVLTVCGVLTVLIESLDKMTDGAKEEGRKMRRNNNNVIDSKLFSVTSLEAIVTFSRPLSRYDLFSDYADELMINAENNSEESDNEDNKSDNSSLSDDSDESSLYDEDQPLLFSLPIGDKENLNHGKNLRNDVEGSLYINEEQREGQQSTPQNLPKSLMLKSRQMRNITKIEPRAKMKRSCSSGSASSFHSNKSEGPPPGYYFSPKYHEEKWQRTLRLRKGYFLATVNVLLDSYGSLLTKRYGEEMSTWEINFIRMGFAGLFMMLVSLLFIFRDKLLGNSMQARTEHNSSIDLVPWYRLPKMKQGSWLATSVGVLFVTFLCPALTNYALFEIPLALAVTLTSTTPLYTLPLSWLTKGERPTKRGVWGLLMAFAGVSVLCVFGIATTEENIHMNLLAQQQQQQIFVQP